MFHRSLVVGAALAMVAPVYAQQNASPSAAQDAVMRRQIQTFELALRSAIEEGGQRFAERASQVVPNMVWFQADPVVIDNFILPEHKTLLFQVRVPNLRPTSLAFLDQFQGLRSSLNAQNGASPQNVSSGRTSASGGGILADPMTSSPVIADPNREYVEEVKTALLSAMLDRSGVLVLSPDYMLIIAASAVDVAGPTPLYNQPTPKMYLEIKASDLNDLRDHKITRDVARTRIVERRF